MKVSNKWRKMAEIYKQFSQMKRVPDAPPEHIKIWDAYDADRDFSEEAMLEAFEKESYGTPHPIRRNNGKINGYIEGKQWMDLTITEYWLPDLESRELFSVDLYEDLPEWYLKRVLPERLQINEKPKN